MISSQTTIKRIQREVADLQREDLGQIVLAPSEDNMYLWKGSIPGPEGSIYEGGVFEFEVHLAPDYPYAISGLYDEVIDLGTYTASQPQKSCSRHGKSQLDLDNFYSSNLIISSRIYHMNVRSSSEPPIVGISHYSNSRYPNRVTFVSIF